MPLPSYPFLFLYVPAALAGYFLCGRLGVRAASLWLAAISLLFWAANAGTPAVFLLLIVAALAYLCGEVIAGARERSPAAKLPLLTGLAFLLAAGLACKGFAPAPGAWRIGGEATPWALSFFLFAQAAYFVDLYRGMAPSPSLGSHALGSAFFPRLAAGPPLPAADWEAQGARPGAFRFQPENTAAGLGLFACGLAKKTVLADNLSLLARHLFDDLAPAGAPGFFFAWTGALAFAFQIYFELSGYVDMARGLSRMFNIVLPPVFDAPYRARTVSAFWSRWYRPLWEFGGSLAALLPARARPLAPLAAFAALGLWHGATAPFLAWGAWSGLCLTVQRSGRGPALPSPAAGALTFLAILAGWVVFRSATLSGAGTVFAAMAGAGPHESPVRQLLPLFQGPEAKEYACAFLALAASPFLALFGPSNERRFGPGWRPTPLGALAAGGTLLLAILFLPSAREFLYARF